MKNADIIVKKLELQPHPEGGYFKEVYRSEEKIKTENLPERFDAPHCFGTSIYYLLEGEQFSAFHRIKADETWHFYFGSQIIIHIISEEGEYSKIVLGKNVEEDEQFQYTVPFGLWFAAEVKDKNSFSLVGCTVAPGFDFSDFEMGSREKLINEFPQHQNLIEKFTL